MIGRLEEAPRRSSGLAERRLRAATRAWSCCKMLMVPLDVFSLLEMGRVTVEFGATGDATTDKARKRVVNRAAGSMIYRCSNMGTILDHFVAIIYIIVTNVNTSWHTVLKR